MPCPSSLANGDPMIYRGGVITAIIFNASGYI